MKRTSIFSIKAEGGKAVIRIIGRISEWRDTATNFIQQINDLVDQGITDATLYIRTEGGSVFEANDIANEIMKFKGTIDCETGSLVASAGTYIAIKCSRVKVPANTNWMFHKPQAEMEGNEDEIKRQLKLLSDLTTIYAKAYAKKTGKTVAEIETFWSKGEQWLTAQELLDWGFIDEIMEGNEEITPEDISTLKAIGYKNMPKIAASIKQPKPLNTMKISAKAAGLASDANDEMIADHITAQNDKITKLEAFKTDHEKKEKDQVKAAIETAVKNAIAEKKITAELKDTYTSIGENSGIEALTRVFEGMKAIKKVSSSIPDGGGDGEGITGEKKDWSFNDWSEKDPQGLAVLHKENPEAFKALYKAEFNTDPE